MKKKLSYRDKLLELAYIYNVKEIKDYVKSRKNLTTGQLELILKKNSIVIPKDFNNSFIKENIFKPISKIKIDITEFKENQIKVKNRFLRKTENFNHDIKRKISGSLKILWNNLGKVGLNFLNIMPKLGKTVYLFFSNTLIEFFSGIYNQQINPKSARNAIIGFFVIAGLTTVTITGVTNYMKIDNLKIAEVKKPEEQEQKTKTSTQVKKKEEKLKTTIQVKKKEEKLKTTIQVKKKRNQN